MAELISVSSAHESCLLSCIECLLPDCSSESSPASSKSKLWQFICLYLTDYETNPSNSYEYKKSFHFLFIIMWGFKITTDKYM